MLYRRVIATLLLPVMAIQFAGCHKWSGASDPMQHVRDHDPWHIRVTLKDGEVVELWDAEIVDDEIVGFTERPPRAKNEQAQRERAELPQARGSTTMRSYCFISFMACAVAIACGRQESGDAQDLAEAIAAVERHNVAVVEALSTGDLGP